jgi:acyl transferase domain-containing protein/thioesterase domain-containing protein/SAM-dependent methyltransferase/acyl carrier protein
VIGIGCRFPGADGPDAFWRLLRNGVNAITEVPGQRWDADELYDPRPSTPGKMNTRWGGFLSDVDRFDAAFFRISPREARRVDPQQRLLLEVAWEALEDAGQVAEQLAGSATGVFVGISNDDYARLQLSDLALDDAYAGTGSALSIAANRLSYWFDLRGPSLAVDTACSSSLVAVHLACRSLRGGECSLALAGGVNLILTPALTVNFTKAGFMAPDGLCKAFDSRADGYVRGEGAGVVVLKPLAVAIEDGDPIYAVIRGSAVNQDGRTNGLTAPNRWAQEAVLRSAYANAGVAPAEVTLIEAHGTGTALGDPIEAGALGAVLAEDRAPDRLCSLGSVKTNIGHLEAAAGIAGLIKVALALQHRELPPTLHFEKPNPLIPFADLPLRVQTTLAPWQGPLRAGVSAFGFGGTNAHVVLEGPPETPAAANATAGPFLLPLSAQSPSALRMLAEAWAGHLRELDPPAVADLCYTAAVRRSHHDVRLAVQGASGAELADLLAAFCRGEGPRGLSTGTRSRGREPEVVFVFPGQGAQWLHMGRRLLDQQPIFRASLERTEAALRAHVEWSLLEELTSGATSHLECVDVVQPVLFAIQVALAELWRSWGVEPDAVVGQSMGEVAAAHVAGALSLEDAAKIICLRSRLMRSVSGRGGMAAVELSFEQARTSLAGYEDRLEVAVSNSPTSSVLSGDSGALAEVVATLEANNVLVRSVKVDVAAHSPHMTPLREELLDILRDIRPAAPSIPLYSTVTGELAGSLDAAYWVRNLRDPVLFSAAVQQLVSDGHRHFLEISPHPILLGSIQQGLDHAGKTGVVLASLRREEDEQSVLLGSLGELYCRGHAPDWDSLYESGRCVRLPFSYPWQRERFWLDELALPAPQPRPDGPATWEAVVLAGREQAEQGPLDLGLETFGHRLETLDRAATAAMIDALRRLGAFARSDEPVGVDSVLERCRILPAYRNLVGRWLGHLARSGALRREGDRYVGSLTGETADWAEAREAWASAPQLVAYLERCAERLPSILRGEESPLETLFPGGSPATADFLYREWAVARYFNAIAAAVLRPLLDALPKRRPLRILEVGAGTGGMTGAILPGLPEERTSYHFTDVSEFFFRRGEERFAAYPFVEYRTLDIEEPPEKQGFASHSYDLVIAANVLHATRDLGTTLDHVASLLAPGGSLLLYETTTHPLWFDISVGLIEGWQRFDDDLRKDNPLLSAGQWVAALSAHEFGPIAAFPEPASSAAVLGQHVLVARATGTETGSPHLLPAEPVVEPKEQSESPRSSIAGELLAAPEADQLSRLELYFGDLIKGALRLPSALPLEPDQPLDELGFDSLMVVELATKLEAALGSTVPFSYFRPGVTVAQLAAQVLALLRLDQQPAGAEAADPVLVRIKPTGSRIPFFCVTAGYGDLIAFEQLATELGPDQPFYALQPPLEGSHDSLGDLAADYAAAMRRVQPEGPYLVGGYCSGGIAAYALAQLLIAEGQEVRRLVLLDTPWVYSHFDHLAYRALKATIAKRLPSPSDSRRRLPQILWALCRDRGLERHLKLIAGYVPRAYPGPIALFLPRGSFIRFTHARRAWHLVARGRQEVYVVAGDHDNFLRGKRLAGMARLLRECLERAGGQQRLSAEPPRTSRPTP